MDPKGPGSELQETRGAAPLLLLGPLIALGLPRPAAASASPAAPPQPITYSQNVAPLFGRWCVSCHSGAEAHAELWLDSYAGVIRGGETGPVVVPGDPAGSLLLAKVERRHRPAMPPRRKLPTAALRLIRAWIASGAAP